MIKPVYTWASVLILLALGAYVFYFERGPVPLPAPSPPPQILRFESATVVRLTLLAGKRKMSLSRSGPEAPWRFDSPAQGGVDSSRINSLLAQLSDWPAAQVLEADLPVARRAEFGLAPPALTLTLDTTKARYVIKIGQQTPVRSGYYVLGAEGKGLLLSYVNIPEALQQFLTSPPVTGASKS